MPYTILKTFKNHTSSISTTCHIPAHGNESSKLLTFANELCVWDLGTVRNGQEATPLHTVDIMPQLRVCIHLSGNEVLMAGEGGKLYFWDFSPDPRNGNKLPLSYYKSVKLTDSLILSASMIRSMDDSQLLFCGTFDGHMLIYDLGQKKTRLKVKLHGNNIWGLEVIETAECYYVFTSGSDYLIKLHRISKQFNKVDLLDTCIEHKETVYMMKKFPGGIVSGSYDGMIFIRLFSNFGTVAKKKKMAGDVFVGKVANKGLIITNSGKNLTFLRKKKNNATLYEEFVHESIHKYRITDINFIPTEGLLVTASNDKTIQIIDCSGNPLWEDQCLLTPQDAKHLSMLESKGDVKYEVPSATFSTHDSTVPHAPPADNTVSKSHNSPADNTVSKSYVTEKIVEFGNTIGDQFVNKKDLENKKYVPYSELGAFVESLGKQLVNQNSITKPEFKEYIIENASLRNQTDEQMRVQLSFAWQHTQQKETEYKNKFEQLEKENAALKNEVKFLQENQKIMQQQMDKLLQHLNGENKTSEPGSKASSTQFGLFIKS